jgi:NifU-like protein involved in Fe-S cluster formation
MVIGRTIDDAYKITPLEIIKELGGLPKRKIHCSVLGDQALRVAIDNYKNKKK